MGIASEEVDESPPVRFLKPQERFPVLSHGEFMRLTPQAQADYILVMRDFMVDLSRIAPNGMPTTAHHKWELFLHYLGLETMPEAQAAGDENCRLARVVQGGAQFLQLYCEGKNGKIDTINVLTSPYGTPQEVAERLSAELAQSQGLKVSVDTANLARQVAAYEADGYDGALSFKQEIKYPSGVSAVEVKVLPTRSEPVILAIPSEDASKKPVSSDPLTERIKVDDKGTVIEKVSNTPQDLSGTGQPITDISGKKRAQTFREAENASMKKLKKLEDDHKGPLRCIYAGFAIKKTPENDSCQPVGSFMSEKSKKVFACKKEDISEAHSNAGGEVILPKKAPSGKVVLCNPLVFGLDKDGAPFCVPRNKKATESCRFVSSKASQKEASIKSAVELARENPMVLSQIRWTYERLCQGNDDDIKSLLGGSSEAQLKKSKADLAQTCAAYEQKLGEFPNGGRLGNSGSGQK
ncbi:MAG: hypothetical protein KF789_06785 [Bdellovibrionaceae bacterium]|nr:hypothetical protein [Pseudobdellovibrionaceae bacterium]